MRRRQLLMAIAGGLALGVVVRPAAAASKLQRVEKGKGGVTLTFALDRAPFPSPGEPYRDSTVVVFVPAFYRLPKSRRIDAVVHFHGHLSTVRAALDGHQLREQLVDSKQNAVLVVPQGPVNAADGSGGKLERTGGLSRLLREVVHELSRPRVGAALGKSSLSGARGVGMLCLSAHSGGYRVAAACLRRGGVNVNEVYLFDALYGHVKEFRRWVVARKGKRGRARHKLVCHYAGGEVHKNSLALLADLRRAGVPVLHETTPGQLTRAQLTGGTAIFIKSPLAHGKVTFRHNNLRDCLYASGLRRRLKSDWFEEKDEARDIDRRDG